jgi:hypothetical protein
MVIMKCMRVGAVSPQPSQAKLISDFTLSAHMLWLKLKGGIQKIELTVVITAQTRAIPHRFD